MSNEYEKMSIAFDTTEDVHSKYNARMMTGMRNLFLSIRETASNRCSLYEAITLAHKMNYITHDEYMSILVILSDGVTIDTDYAYLEDSRMGACGRMTASLTLDELNKTYYRIKNGPYIIPPRGYINNRPKIKNVIFNNPATIVFWVDGTKTVVKAQNGEKYDEEKGLAMAIVKKIYGNEGNYYNIIKKWTSKK